MYKDLALQNTSNSASRVSKDTISAHLLDGQTISVPLVWPWRLSEATAEGILYGTPAPKPPVGKK
jgi:hypothetical protein